MSILKSEIRQQTVTDIGVKIEDTLEAARKDVAMTEGKMLAFLEGAKAVEGVVALLQKDIESGVVPLETGNKVRDYLTRGVQTLQQLGMQATTMRHSAAGKVLGLEQTVRLLKQLSDLEQAKIEKLKELEAAPAQAEAAPQEVPVHQFVSIKEQRLMEAAVVEDEDLPKRRGRKPRASNS